MTLAETRPPASADVDYLFKEPQREHLESIMFSDLPYITRPLIEAIHDLEPDAVIAADRGGRPVALAVMMGWKYRYPGERFPTHDSRIHLGRISARSTYDNVRTDAVTDTLDRAGICAGPSAVVDPSAAKVVLIDDWSIHGDTYSYFIKGAEGVGVKEVNTCFMTMCGPQINNNHVVGDTSRDPRNSEWNDNIWAVGVSFRDTVRPMPEISEDSLALRHHLATEMASYYGQFVKAFEQKGAVS